jgi:hypothetical protein
MQAGFGRRVKGLVVDAWVALLATTSTGSTLAGDSVLAARMAAGPPGNRPVAVDVSAAHALVR